EEDPWRISIREWANSRKIDISLLGDLPGPGLSEIKSPLSVRLKSSLVSSANTANHSIREWLQRGQTKNATLLFLQAPLYDWTWVTPHLGEADIVTLESRPIRPYSHIFSRFAPALKVLSGRVHKQLSIDEQGPATDEKGKIQNLVQAWEQQRNPTIPMNLP